MSKLDFLTLLVVTATNLFMVSAALPLIMGREVSQAARWAQASLLLQALSWASIIASGYWFDPFFSTLTMFGACASQVALNRALAGWMGPRPREWPMLAITVAMPLGYALLWNHYPWRVGWSNFLLALQMLLAARATLFPLKPVGRRWRLLLCGALVTMAVFTAWRGVLGAFYPELYPRFRAPHPVNLAAGLAANVTLVLSTVALLVAWREEAERQLRALAMSDGLTDLLNRRGWFERAEAAFAQARRHDLPLALLMLDVDHFKQINDQHGHAAGDRALQLFARLLRENQRGEDVVGRLGGEEFCVLLAHADAGAGHAFDQRLRGQLRRRAEAELGFPIDYSAGLGQRLATDLAIEPLLKRADSALYQAKRAGRGRLAVFRPAAA